MQKHQKYNMWTEFLNQIEKSAHYEHKLSLLCLFDADMINWVHLHTAMNNLFSVTPK